MFDRETIRGKIISRVIHAAVTETLPNRFNGRGEKLRIPEQREREETFSRNVFTPGETNCACTILLNLSTTLARLHSLMSFRSGGRSGWGRNEVGTSARRGGGRSVGASGAADGRHGQATSKRRAHRRFASRSNLHTFRAGIRFSFGAAAENPAFVLPLANHHAPSRNGTTLLHAARVSRHGEVRRDRPLVDHSAVWHLEGRIIPTPKGNNPFCRVFFYKLRFTSWLPRP